VQSVSLDPSLSFVEKAGIATNFELSVLRVENGAIFAATFARREILNYEEAARNSCFIV
jgi:hypothetical protein